MSTTAHPPRQERGTRYHDWRLAPEPRPRLEARHDDHTHLTGTWLYSRWERDTRYYELRVQQDLFGHWLLTRIWGRRGSALGQIRHELCETYAAGLAKLAQAEARRAKHGYTKTRGQALPP